MHATAKQPAVTQSSRPRQLKSRTQVMTDSSNTLAQHVCALRRITHIHTPWSHQPGGGGRSPMRSLCAPLSRSTLCCWRPQGDSPLQATSPAATVCTITTRTNPSQYAAWLGSSSCTHHKPHGGAAQPPSAPPQGQPHTLSLAHLGRDWLATIRRAPVRHAATVCSSSRSIGCDHPLQLLRSHDASP